MLGQKEEGDLSHWDSVLLFPGELSLVRAGGKGDAVLSVEQSPKGTCGTGSDSEQGKGLMDFHEP